MPRPRIAEALLSADESSIESNTPHAHWPCFSQSGLAKKIVEILKVDGFQHTYSEPKPGPVCMHHPEMGYVRIDYSGKHYIDHYVRFRMSEGPIAILMSTDAYAPKDKTDDEVDIDDGVSKTPDISALLVHVEPNVREIYNRIEYEICLLGMDHNEREPDKRHYHMSSRANGKGRGVTHGA